jgi:hypothetical protein
MGFGNIKSVSYNADAPSFSAAITPGVNIWSATLTYKAGWKAGPPSITARDMDALMAALTKQDSGVKFYKTDADAGTLAAKDVATLEAMRTDTDHVSDLQYRSACRNFGQQPQPRPTRAANKTNATQSVTPFLESATAWQEFEREHGELWSKPFGDMNCKIILQYLADENMQVTKANLAQAHRELKAANCFRSPNTLSRDINGSLTIVQPYSHARILALRQKQAAAAANAAPAGLSEVDREAWEAVHGKYPQLSVHSAEFKQCCSNTILLWAREYVLEQQPELAAANKKGELRKAVDTVVTQWTRNPNLGQGQKTIKDTRIWLG